MRRPGSGSPTRCGPRSPSPRPCPAGRAARRCGARRHGADPAGQRRIHPARTGPAPGATIVLFGSEDPRPRRPRSPPVPAALIRGGDQDLVSVVAKAVLLLCVTGRMPAASRAGRRGRRGRPAPTRTRRPGRGRRRLGADVAGDRAGAARRRRCADAALGGSAEDSRFRQPDPRRPSRPAASAGAGDPARRTDRARAAGAARHGRRQEQRRDRARAVRLGGHRQDPRPAAVPQAGRARPGPRRGRGFRAGLVA